MDRLLSATNFAALKHSTQRRKDAAKSPYINHPVEVANFLAQAGVTDVEVLMAALLHDTIEDTQTTYAELVENFGERVANMVQDCSDNKSLSKVDRKRLQLEHAKHVAEGSKLVKLGDKYSNVSGLLKHPPASWTEQEIKGYAVWAYAVVRKLRGLNSSIDKQFNELYSNFGLNTVTDEELDVMLQQYYKNIDKSE
jgi:guanosine-3',5'-bis(diphosphate) 3'-pyrophosphohydrolase